MISIVIPVYHGENFVNELVNKIRITFKSINIKYEILLINDASPDNSWEKIKNECLKDKNVKGINLSRNFGQHYAISAGLESAAGDWIVVMDCDLQDQPEEIPLLYYKAVEGNDIVLALRESRKDSILKKLLSKLFYTSLSWLTGVEYDHRVANFGIYKRKVVDAILLMGDNIRFFPSMVKWVGFKATTVTVKHAPRKEGKSSYNLNKLIKLALDIVLSYSDKPIRLAIKTGLIISVFSLIATLYTLIRTLSGKIEVPGYASIIISIWFFSGLIIANIGIIGLYVSKTFQAARKRPIYIIQDKINME